MAKKTKKSAQRGLGRGLSALMSDVSFTAPDTTPVKPKKTASKAPKKKSSPKANSVKPKKNVTKQSSTAQQRGVVSVNIDRLERNPDQPRKYFDKEKLAELTKSIADKGVLQPILVRPLPNVTGASKSSSARYQIVAGERRWQAALKAKLDAMPVLIRELSDQEVLEIGVVENVQRADLNPIEEALAYRALSEQFKRTQDDIAQAVGKSRPHVTNMLRLLSLPKRAQTYLAKGKISAGHARAIIAAPDPVELADAIAQRGLSVREAEDWVRRIKAAQGKAVKVSAQKDADIRKVENDLANMLGLKADLRHKGPGGELRLKYKTARQLEALLKRLTQ